MIYFVRSESLSQFLYHRFVVCSVSVLLKYKDKVEYDGIAGIFVIFYTLRTTNYPVTTSITRDGGREEGREGEREREEGEREGGREGGRERGDSESHSQKSFISLNQIFASKATKIERTGL